MAVYTIRRILLESYPVLVLCALIGVIAGYLLHLQMEKIMALPMILMMVPPLNDLGGSVGSILGARLASALHLGTLQPKFRGEKVLYKNVMAALLMSLGTFSFVSTAFFVISYTGGMAFVESIRMMMVFFIAALMLTIVVIISSVVSAFVSFAKGLDPDNVVVPIVTAVGDISGIISLIIAITVIGV
jgi:mgtE-like transporter